MRVRNTLFSSEGHRPRGLLNKCGLAARCDFPRRLVPRARRFSCPVHPTLPVSQQPTRRCHPRPRTRLAAELLCRAAKHGAFRPTAPQAPAGCDDGHLRCRARSLRREPGARSATPAPLAGSGRYGQRSRSLAPRSRGPAARERQASRGLRVDRRPPVIAGAGPGVRSRLGAHAGGAGEAGALQQLWTAGRTPVQREQRGGSS